MKDNSHRMILLGYRTSATTDNRSFQFKFKSTFFPLRESILFHFTSIDFLPYCYTPGPGPQKQIMIFLSSWYLGVTDNIGTSLESWKLSQRQQGAMERNQQTWKAIDRNMSNHLQLYDSITGKKKSRIKCDRNMLVSVWIKSIEDGYSLRNFPCYYFSWQE